MEQPHKPKLQIKDKTEKPESGGSRAPKATQVSKALAKVIKKAAQIADLMTGQDVEDDLRVLREAKLATHFVYSTERKSLVEAPDHKTRLAATTLSRAYHEGKPVERSITAHVDTDDFERMLEVAREVQAQSLQKTVQGKEIPPAIEDSPSDGQVGGS